MVASAKKVEEPEYDDLKERERKMRDNEEISDLSDSDLEIEYDDNAKPKEVIFAELERGQYFGVLGLQTGDPHHVKLRDGRNKKCFSSVWCLQNTHTFYIENKHFQEFLRNQQERLVAEKKVFLRQIPFIKLLTYKQLLSLTGCFQYFRYERGNFLFEQGDDCTHLYIIKDGEFKLEIKQEQDKPAFTDVELDKIFVAPLQANFHNSDHNVKNKSKFVKKISLGYQGNNNTLGLFEAVQRLPTYRYSAQCTSNEAELLGVKIDDLHKAIKSNVSVLEELKNMVLSMSEQIAIKIRSKDKVIRQLDRKLQNSETPDPSKEITFEERLKNLKRTGNRRNSQNENPGSETGKATNFMSTRRTTASDLGSTKRPQSIMQNAQAFINAPFAIIEKDERQNSNSPKKYIQSVNYKVPKPYEDETLSIRERKALKVDAIKEQFPKNPYVNTAAPQYIETGDNVSYLNSQSSFARIPTSP